MPAPNQKRLLFGLLENAPSIAFLALLQADAGLRLTGWVSTGLAAVVFACYAGRRLAPHPILLGINLYMLAITPVIETLYLAGAGRIGAALIDHAQSGVFIAVLATGAAQAAFAQTGFVGAPLPDPGRRRRSDAVMLGACAVAVAWSMTAPGGRIVAIALPFLMLFGLRQWLLARDSDRPDPPGAAVPAMPAVPTPGATAGSDST